MSLPVLTLDSGKYLSTALSTAVFPAYDPGPIYICNIIQATLRSAKQDKVRFENPCFLSLPVLLNDTYIRKKKLED